MVAYIHRGCLSVPATDIQKEGLHYAGHLVVVEMQVFLNVGRGNRQAPAVDVRHHGRGTEGGQYEKPDVGRLRRPGIERRAVDRLAVFGFQLH
jgi:hypothetical protein